MKKRRFLSVILVVVMSLSVCVPAQAASFIDVSSGAWYAESVDYVSDKGYMTGIGGGEFAPEMTASRGMIAAMLYRMEGEPSMGATPDFGYPFKDVSAKAYYANAIYWARYQGIMAGYNGTYFGPDDMISREQLASVLRNYSAYKGRDVSQRANVYIYADANYISDWAMDGMQWAVATGILGGNERYQLLPQDPATRAQLASVIMRLMTAGDNPMDNIYPRTVDSLPITIPTTFVYASGVGAWASVLTLNDNLSFEGEYHDSDFMDRYYSHFRGRFAPEIVQTGPYTYRIKLLYAETYGEGNYVNGYGVNCIYANDACGLGKLATSTTGQSGYAMEYVFYTPQASTAGMDATFLATWPGRTGHSTTLGYYAIENLSTHQGFFAS